ncbi:glycosyltransferase family 32 protein [Clostridium chauvoei]|nr:glycosyltransferase [Clostridium chauvoei]MBX7370426.1 glycosyl transferase [Clostridium chauvoei]MBX7372882.1 glycosyl transferase [Clostridium chauvoei]MBX7385489.1 glycosyl transferase [Clostridium chauvoei]MBX7420749.1 glycosyl transferase [Clostridium chauvoei]
MGKSGIPKIIHYCWFGRGEKSELANRCIESWKKNLDGYKIMEWNEDNFDISANLYIKEAYDKGKYAFVSDYVRLDILFKYGGIYLDTDVEILSDFNALLDSNAFLGFEDDELISTATIGARKNNIIIKNWLDTYNNRRFIKNGRESELTNVRVVTDILLNHGLKQDNRIQNLLNDEITIYSNDFFSPLKIGSSNPKVTHNTIAIHWFEGTWLTPQKK